MSPKAVFAGLVRASAILTIAMLIPRVAHAQPQRSSPVQVAALRQAAKSYPVPPLEANREAKRLQESSGAQPPSKPPKSVIGWSIAIGVGAGLATSAIAASKYGENEGGQFCGRCFMEWSAITVPVGAGAGALIGYLIDRSRR
jgi:hypothetical protein